MEDLYLEIITKVLVAFGLLLVGLIWKFFKKWLENKVIKDIISDGIKYAQQVYGHLEGPERYQRALVIISKRLENWGIKLTEVELRVMIEAILVEIKKEYGPLWKELSSKKKTAIP